jgi:hypothetical protein
MNCPCREVQLTAKYTKYAKTKLEIQFAYFAWFAVENPFA